MLNLPQDFIPVVDSVAQKVIHIDFPPHYRKKKSGNSIFDEHGLDIELSNNSAVPPPLSVDPLKYSERDRIPPPKESWDFLPDLMMQKPGDNFKLRDDVKPLHVVQPEGVSFTVDGHVLEWQKWKMHIGISSHFSDSYTCLTKQNTSYTAFSHREGIALSTITYNDDGNIRPVFYRLSLAEMVVPYAAPEHPHPRKHAFDV